MSNIADDASPSMRIDRRSMIAGTLACASCNWFESREADAFPLVPPLRTASNGTIGCAATTADLANEIVSQRLAKQFDQLTPEYEMKMNIIQANDGRRNYTAADKLVEFARAHDQTLHATTLVWYLHQPPYFARMDGKPAALRQALRDYILETCARYKGRVRGWDVVNEPLTANGESLRESLWSTNLGGDGHIIAAFESAREADDQAVLFLNEYDLELRPEKRLAFMRLVERLLKAGVPIGGLGSQTHIRVGTKPEAVRACLQDLASFGLPIHISELDISLLRDHPVIFDMRSLRQQQGVLAGEVTDIFLSLPPAQQYALTLWGMTDDRSHLRGPPHNLVDDEPLAFTASGQAKPMAQAIYESFAQEGNAPAQ